MFSHRRRQMIDIYEKNNDKETSAKFNNLKESLFYYTYPEYVINAAIEALKTIQIRR